MTMTAGNSRGLRAEMNVVPLIDILLVLIIIFMVITPLTPQGVKAEAPQGSKERQVEPDPGIVVVQISRDGAVRINQENVGWNHLQERLEEIFKSRALRVAFVASDPQVEFREVARAIDIMHRANIDRIGLLPGSFGAGRERPASSPSRR